MKNSKVAVLLIVLCFGLVFTGCSEAKANTGNPTIDAMNITQLGSALSKALDERSNLLSQVEDNEEEIARLREIVGGIQFTDPEFPAISRVDDNTDKVSFNKPSDYIRFPEGLAYPGVQPISVNNKLLMGGDNGISLVPASSWVYRLEGNTLYLANTVGVYGELVLGSINSEVKMDDVNIIFEGHPGQAEERDEWDRLTQAYIPYSQGVLNFVPADPGKPAGKDETIFWQNRAVGRQVSLNTLIEGESAVVRIGALAVQSNVVLYTFVYDTERDDKCEAAIMNLLLTLAIQSRAIAIGF